MNKPLDHETETLEQELEYYRAEKDKVRQVVGQIGGVKSARWDHILTIAFLTIIIVLFVLDVSRHILKIDIPLPPLCSIQLGVLLVSIKIIWMIQKQARVEHFQFWILNSIEFRLNNVAKKIENVEKALKK